MVIGVTGAVVLGAAALGAGASIYSSNQQASAAGQAADQSSYDSEIAMILQYNQQKQNRADQMPWLKAGQNAVNQLNAGMSPGGRFTDIPKFSFDPSQVANDPGYKFAKSQGESSIASKAAAAGNYGSGNMGVALDQFGQGNAMQYENQFFNQDLSTYGQNLNSQYTMPYNMLAGLSGAGQQQSQAMGSQGLQAATNMGNYAQNAGNAQAAGTMGAANAYSQGVNGVVGNIQSGYGNYLGYQQNQNLLNAMQQNQGSNFLTNTASQYGGNASDWAYAY